MRTGAQFPEHQKHNYTSLGSGSFVNMVDKPFVNCFGHNLHKKVVLVINFPRK